MPKPKEPVLTSAATEEAPKKKKKKAPAPAPEKAQAVTQPLDIAEIRDALINAALEHAKQNGTIISQWAPYAAAFRTAWPYFLKRWNEEHRG